MSLVLDSISVSRGAGPVVADVSLTLRPGQITALVGPNGAGKTSLLEAISGIIAPSAGSITLDGKPFDKLTRVQRARAGVAHIEQGRAIFPSLTVSENIRLTAGSQAGVDTALERFPELQKRRDSASGLLSGGEQQMVVLARAFASHPRFLLIDEMSLGLAPVVFTRLLPMVQQFSESGVGVLLVEQFTHLALAVAADALVVASGQVTWSGPAAELQAAPELLHQAYLGSS